MAYTGFGGSGFALFVGRGFALFTGGEELCLLRCTLGEADL
jgi:hypothetical protein